MTVANLFARIGIKADTAQGEKVGQLFKNLLGDVRKLAIGTGSFTAALILSMKSALDGAAAFREFSATTGQSVEELQRWQNVAAGANVDTKAISESVRELASNREKIKLGQGNFSGFAFLGINPMDDPFKILDQLRTKMTGLAPAMQANLLRQMGVSDQFLQVLRLTDDQFKALKADAFVIPQSAIDAMSRTQSSLNQLGQMTKWFQALLAERLAPIIDKVVKSITLWVKQNKDGLIKGITDITRWLVTFLGAIVNVATWMGRLISGTIGWQNAMNALLGAIVYFNRALLFTPIGAMIAGIVLLILMLDDLHAALHIDGDNRESFFGKIFAKNPELRKMFTDIFGIISDLTKLLASFGKGDVFDIKKILDQWGSFGDVVRTLYAMLISLKQLMYDIFSGHWGDIIKNQMDNPNLAGLYGNKESQADSDTNILKFAREAAAQKAAGGGNTVVTQNNQIVGSFDKQAQDEALRRLKEAMKTQANRSTAGNR